MTSTKAAPSLQDSVVRQKNVDPVKCVGEGNLYLSPTMPPSYYIRNKIRPQQKFTNEEVLRHTGLTTLYTTLSQRRLGHVLRMSASQSIN